MKILVGSTNPVKIQATTEAFSKYYSDIEVIGFCVNSNVYPQPINYDTFTGAENRVKELQKVNSEKNLNAEYFVGIEGGIIRHMNKWFAFGCMCIMDKNGRLSFGTSPHFELPEEVYSRLLNGEELGEVMDEIIQLKNTKQNSGAIGFLTNGVMNRTQLYVPGIIAALVPFNHIKMYFGEKL